MGGACGDDGAAVVVGGPGPADGVAGALQAPASSSPASTAPGSALLPGHHGTRAADETGIGLRR